MQYVQCDHKKTGSEKKPVWAWQGRKILQNILYNYCTPKY